MLIDPDGRTISGDEAMVKRLEEQAGKLKKGEESRQERLQNRINKLEAKGKSTEKLQGKMEESKARVKELDGLTSDIASLRNSDQNYNINSNWTAPEGSGISGEAAFNAKTGPIDINISASYGLAGLAHELTHGAQFDRGEIDCAADGSSRGYLADISDEISSYKRQHIISGNSGSIFGINESFIRNLNSTYHTMPGNSLNSNSTVLGILVSHLAVNPAIKSYPSFNEGIKSYKDAKTTTFGNYISR